MFCYIIKIVILLKLYYYIKINPNLLLQTIEIHDNTLNSTPNINKSHCT